MKNKLQDIYNNTKKCAEKIASATKFIDFFVHDILDYTVLNKDAEKFCRNITNENVLKVLNEIKETMQDKVDMKSIKVSISFVGMNEQDHIKTDLKRL